MLRMAGQGLAGRSDDEVPELAVGVVSRMRVAVRFEIGRPSCVRAFLLPPLP